MEGGPGLDRRSPERGFPVGAPPQPIALDAALDRIPDDARALVLLDGRLYRRISGDLLAYVRAAAARRGFPIAVLPIIGLDDRQPPEIRRALQAWRAARPALEGTLFVGNVKLPSFFMPRVDTPSTRLWPRYFEDLDMTPERKIPPGTILGECGPERPWPCVAGRKELEVPEHDFDVWTPGPSGGPELWAGFLPVGRPGDASDDPTTGRHSSRHSSGRRSRSTRGGRTPTAAAST